MRIVFVLVCGLIPCMLMGQSFHGQVFDQDTKAPIPFAEVFFPALHTGTTSDGDGNFSLDDLPKSTLQMQISFLGYNTLLTKINPAQDKEGKYYLSPSHIDLQEVVFSVPGGKLQNENIVNIERKKLVEVNLGANSLAETISHIPGVDQNTTGAGIGKPVIRGLSGNRILTYAQGVRVENQQWGDEHGLGISDLGIESVEVIKGPASLLYGSDALGGVLYFVDERYADHNTVEAQLDTRFLSNSLGTQNKLGLKIHKQDLKLNIFGGYSSHADYTIPGGNRVLNTRFDEKSFKTALGFTKGSWVSNLSYSFVRNNFGITEDALYHTSGDRSKMLPYQKVDNHILSYENTLYMGSSNLNLVLGYAENDRQEYADSFNEPGLDMRLKSLTYNLKWTSATLGQHLSLFAGTQGMHKQNKNFGSEVLIPDATTNDLGLYSIASYELDKFRFQGGIRGDLRYIDALPMMTGEVDFDALNKTYGSFNYSAGGVFHGKTAVFRLNLSSGFRAPNTNELLSNGVHEGTFRYEIGNPDLNSENATQLDFTFENNTEHFDIFVSPFINIISDYIYLSPSDSVIEGIPVYNYLQKDALLYGGEAGIHWHPHQLHWLHIESNISTVMAEDRQGNALPLIPATRINSTISAEFNKKGIFSLRKVFLQHLYKFDQRRTGMFETDTPGYQTVNAGADFDLGAGQNPLLVSIGVNNLFNVKYIDHLSRFKPMGIPNPGINFYVGIKAKLFRQLATN